MVGPQRKRATGKGERDDALTFCYFCFSFSFFLLCPSAVLSFKDAKQGLILISLPLCPGYTRVKGSSLPVTQGPRPHQMEVYQEARGQELKWEVRPQAHLKNYFPNWNGHRSEPCSCLGPGHLHKWEVRRRPHGCCYKLPSRRRDRAWNRQRYKRNREARGT